MVHWDQLYAVFEPGGHEFSEMRTLDSAMLMNDLADQAEAFTFDGTVYL